MPRYPDRLDLATQARLKMPSAEQGAANTSSDHAIPQTNEALVHELRVHQIELEMQNEQLRRTELDLAATRDRYIDLYDFAPMGYFTLSNLGVITEANLTGAARLGVDRDALLGQQFARFIAAPDAARWQGRMQHAQQELTTERIELTVKPQTGALFFARLDCMGIKATNAPTTLRVTLTDITQTKIAEMDRRIADSMVQSREAEKRHIARELHEDLGQRLCALKMNLATLPLNPRSQAQVQHLNAIQAALDEAVAVVRRIVTELRPLLLDDLGFNAAIDWLARDTAQRLGFEVTVRLEDTSALLNERTTTLLYRLIQEMLTHIARHPWTAAVDVSVLQRGLELVVVVQSGASTWPAPLDRDSYPEATQSLHEQAHLLRGELEIISKPDGGLKIELRLPIKRSA